MLTPKAQAKKAVLEHVSQAMDKMLSGRLHGKKPMAMHMDAAVIPKESLEGEPGSAEGMMEHPEMPSHLDAVQTPHAPHHDPMGVSEGASHSGPDELDEEALSRLKHHYESLK